MEPSISHCSIFFFSVRVNLSYFVCKDVAIESAFLTGSQGDLMYLRFKSL